MSGKPLIEWTLEAAINSKVFKQIVVSTDSKLELSRLTKYRILDIGVRPNELSLDSTPTIEVINYSLKATKTITKESYDAVVTLQPTSPLRSEEDIKKSVEIFNSNKNADSLVSVVEIPHIHYPERLLTKYTGLTKIENGSKFSTNRYFSPNGAAIYITKIDLLPNKLLGEKCLTYLMPKWRSIDIDTEEDFRIAEILLSNKEYFKDIS
jgi:CMP-N,N'-diacetyllegionaminic acid synthase